MKKQILSIFAAATMLFATSCSEEELTYESASKQNVTFKVEMEGAGASSRALTTDGKEVGQGSKINKVYYAVYETGKQDLLVHGSETMITTEDGAAGSVVIPLVNGLKFDIVFFAQNNEASAFTIPATGDLRNIEFNPSLTANQESYDAFYKSVKEYQSNSNSTTPVVLTRAVAQLNVGTTEDDLDNANALKALATMSKIELDNVYTEFDAREGKAQGTPTSVTFDASNILRDVNWVKDATDAKKYGNEILADVKTDEGEKDFYYLAMAYVLANDESSLHDVDFTFYRGEEGSKEVISTRSLTNVRLQRNYRTNVTGNVLTQQEDFSISLDINFGTNEHNYSVGDVVVAGNATDLQTAIDNAQPGVPVEIQLGSDIILGSTSTSTYSRATESAGLTIPADVTVTLDLNGFTIKQEKKCEASYSMIENKGTLTIKDNSGEKTGKISFKDTGAGDSSHGWGSYTINNMGTLVVENGTIEHLGEQDFAKHMICAIFQYSGSTTINGGTISTPNYRSVRLWKGDMTINGGTFDGQLWVQCVDNSAKLTINGGTFEPNGNDASSVFVENKTYDVAFAVTGGTFQTKIGCSDATKLAGCITGGTFTDEAKKNTEKILFRTIISTAEDLVALGGTKINGIYELAANIDMSGKEMKSMEISGGAKVVFNGNGHIISNLNLGAAGIHGMTGEGNEVAGLFDLSAPATTVSLTVNDLNIKDATVACSGYAAAIVGYNSNGGTVITLNDVDVEGAAVTANSVAALVGYTTGEVNLTDCDVTDLDLTGEEGRPDKVGALVGTANGATCAVTTTNCTNNTTYGDYGRVIYGATWNGAKFESASTQEGLNTALTSGANVELTLAEGEYTLPSGSNSNTLTIKGTKETVVDVTNGSYWDSANLTFEGITIKTGTGYANGNGSDYAALYSPNVTYINVTFVGPMRVGRDGAKFINCTFTALGNDYVWTYGNDVTFEGCTFNTDGKAILIYSDGGNEVSQVSVKNCTFNATQGAKAGAIANQNCAAIEIHNYGNGVNLTTSGNTVDNQKFSGEWRIKTYETGKPKVIVNGTEYTTIALDGKTMTIDTDKNVTVNE